MVLGKGRLGVPAFRIIGIFNAVAPLPDARKQHQAVGHTALPKPENHVAPLHRDKGLRGSGAAQIPECAQGIEEGNQHDSEPVLTIRLVFFQSVRQLTGLQVRKPRKEQEQQHKGEYCECEGRG